MSDFLWHLATAIVLILLLASLVVGWFPLIKWFPVVGDYARTAQLAARQDAGRYAELEVFTT